MPKDAAIDKMARTCYGYGRWDAPYWFIGPEPGQQSVENGDLEPRLRAWVKLGSRELCDCGEFHREIDEHVWHRDGKLQSTWKRVIRLLMAFHERPTDIDTLREYQRERWGMANGETCVIELSGLAANNLTIPRDRLSFREERIITIRERIRVYRPKLIVMYGARQRDSWEAIAGVSPPDGIAVSNGTIFAMTPHPVSYGLKNSYWEDLGHRLRTFAPAADASCTGCRSNK